jgi:hypothetical protein
MRKNSVFSGHIFMLTNATNTTLSLFGRRACGLALLLFLCAAVKAQVPDPVNAAMAPQPGEGHHYIGIGAETVNPADGTLSFDLPIQPPPGRGLTMPFGIRYSGPQEFSITNLNGEPGTLNWLDWIGLPMQFYGWQYDLPLLTAQNKIMGTASEIVQNGNSPTGLSYIAGQCDGTGNYVFRGFDSRQYTLYLGDTYQDPMITLFPCPTSSQMPNVGTTRFSIRR